MSRWSALAWRRRQGVGAFTIVATTRCGPRRRDRQPTVLVGQTSEVHGAGPRGHFHGRRGLHAGPLTWGVLGRPPWGCHQAGLGCDHQLRFHGDRDNSSKRYLVATTGGRALPWIVAIAGGGTGMAHLAYLRRRVAQLRAYRIYLQLDNGALDALAGLK